MLLKQKTDRLFYNKWPYKVTCNVAGAHYIRTFGNVAIQHPDSIVFPKRWHHDHELNQNIILRRFIKEAREFLQDPNIKRRIENRFIEFYVLTKEEFDRLHLTLKEFVVKITEPENKQDLDTLLENKKYILCDRLPHNKYRYKITFKDMSVKIRNDLITWAEKYNNDDIYITKSTRNHFKSIKHHYGSHYFYVKDSKMITLVAMAAGGYVRRTDEYVVRIPKEEA
jgi:hypothetical protein